MQSIFVLALVKFSIAAVTFTQVFQNVPLSRPVDFQADKIFERVYVVSQLGNITAINTLTSEWWVFLDITSSVTCCGETGLLGLAFHPNFASNRYFFTYRTQTTNNQLKSVISRFTAFPDYRTADRSSELILITFNQPYSNHNAGQLAFGSDGYLYIAVGDGGSGGDPNNYAQNKFTMLGKLLRIDVDSTSGNTSYSIPSTNPFVNGGGLPEIFSVGMRNPWRMSFDPVTNWLFVGDVGQDMFEEIDIVFAGDNMGWRTMEGYNCYNPINNCNKTGLKMPIFVYPHSEQVIDRIAGLSITGGYVYRGSAVPDIYGKYIYADWENGRIWALTFNESNPNQNGTNSLVYDSPWNIPTFGIDRCNELYVISYNSGGLFKFTGGGNATCPQLSAITTNGITSGTVTTDSLTSGSTPTTGFVTSGAANSTDAASTSSDEQSLATETIFSAIVLVVCAFI